MTKTPEAPDPFDPEAYRQDAVVLNTNTGAVETPMKVGKPAKDAWVQVHPDPEFMVECHIFERKVENQEPLMYLIPRHAPDVVKAEGPKRILYTCVEFGTSNVFLWPAKVSESGRSNGYNDTSHAIARVAMGGSWLRITTNTTLGIYEARVAPEEFNVTPAKWPDGMTMRDNLRRGFGTRVITDPDDEAIRHRFRPEA